MRKAVLIVLIMAATVSPYGDNVRLYLQGFSSIDFFWKECYYKSFTWRKMVRFKGVCPYSISFNRTTGGWTR